MAHLSKSKRYAILKRDKFTCQYCGARGGELEVDHIEPRAGGGDDDDSNLATACKDCNRGKRDDRLEQPARAGRPRTALFAFHLRPDGAVDYVGEVRAETGAMLRVEVIDGLSGLWGIWDLSGELKDLPKNECRLFTEPGPCLTSANRINDRLLSQGKRA